MATTKEPKVGMRILLKNENPQNKGRVRIIESIVYNSIYTNWEKKPYGREFICFADLWNNVIHNIEILPNREFAGNAIKLIEFVHNKIISEKWYSETDSYWKCDKKDRTLVSNQSVLNVVAQQKLAWELSSHRPSHK